MKINIDETVFNKAIKENKMELAEWLLAGNCPIDSQSCYLQNFNIEVLEWIKNKRVEIPKDILPNVINLTHEQTVLEWFISNGVECDNNATQICIKQNSLPLLQFLHQKYNVALNAGNYTQAVLLENTEILDYLLKNNCEYSSEVLERALREMKKISVKWLANAEFF